MTCHRSSLCFLSLVLASLAFFASAQETETYRISFPAGRVRVPVGDTRMIAFRIEPSPEHDLLLPVSGGLGGVLEVLQPPEVLAGYTLGFLRVRGVCEGSISIRAGTTRLNVSVYDLRRIEPAASEVPIILSPPNGAFLWGTVTAAAEVFRDPLVAREKPDTIVLEALGLREFTQKSESPPEEGPFVRSVFEMTETLLPYGHVTLVARSLDSHGNPTQSPPLQVEVGQVHDPEIRIEAEKFGAETSPSQYTGPASVVVHPGASRNKCVAIRGESQTLTVPFSLKSGGMYQVIARVRGDPGASTFPTMGIVVNEEEEPAAVARLFSDLWHRIPVGRPLRLVKGPNRLSFRYLNDFEVKKLSDRNLFIDTIEIAHVRSLVPLRDMPPPVRSTMMGKEAPMIGGEAPEALGYGPGPLRIAFRSVMHGRKVAGDFRVDARVWWNREAEPMPPRVFLFLNGENVAHVRSSDPVFTVGKSLLRPGVNRIQLQAAADTGESAFTPRQSVWLENSSPPSESLGESRGPDNAPPQVQILYPPEGHEVSRADVVVAWVQDDTIVQSVDLILDEEPQFFESLPENQLGLIVFPVLARSLGSGDHQVRIAARDVDGNEGTSGMRTIAVRGTPGASLGVYDRAVRLLRRFGYGPEPRELAAILTLGEKEWLTKRLRDSFRSPDERTLLTYLRASYPDRGNNSHIQKRVAEQLIRTDNPVLMRLVMWVENHFSTWMQKVGSGSKWDEHLRFCSLGASPFPDLLAASATSPAMLYYLDQHRSFRGQLNENYAREIMELHTLGVGGGYSQRDVTQLAGLLTGWTVADEADPLRPGHTLVRTFRFDPALNEGRELCILGKRFSAADPAHQFDRIRQALEVLSAHPSTASYICEKLITHYVQIPAPEEMRDHLARVFMETGGDMVSVLTAMAGREEFWSPSLPAKFATPLDFGVHLARVAPGSGIDTLNQLLGNSGMVLFGRPTPDGYPEEPAEYADTNSFLQRWNHSQALQHVAATVIPESWKNRRRFGSSIERQRLVDLAAIRLTGSLLGEPSNDAAVRVLASSTGSPADRAEQLVAFIGYLPEMHVR